jgi:hypothetical protein
MQFCCDFVAMGLAMKAWCMNMECAKVLRDKDKVGSRKKFLASCRLLTNFA